MKTTTLVISIVIALIVGGGVGYFSGKGTTNSTQVQSKELQDSITMMNTQSTTIQKMAEMMKSSGVMMQEIGMKYENTDTVTKGKDLEMMGIKYLGEKNQSESTGTMKNMMK